MSAEKIGGIARAVLAAVGGVFVTLGWVDDATVQQVVGALAVIATAGWSIYAKRAK